MAQRQPVIVLTDLDQMACPQTLVDEWFSTRHRPANLLLRVAVRQAESWLLADHEAMRHLIGHKGVFPPCPDDLANAKQHLLQLAKHATREVRLDLMKVKGAISSQGIGYNARLTALVQTEWSPERAAQRSPSLARTRQRIQALAVQLKKAAASA